MCSLLNLMDLSDCVLYEIFKYLTSIDIWNLSRVNTRLEALALNPLLWKKIEARSGEIDERKNDFCLNKLNEFSRIFCIRGFVMNFPKFPIEKLTENLKILALENQIFDGNKVTLKDFPKKLEELSFRNSTFCNSVDFFKRTSEYMSNLKVLLLDNCANIYSCSIMSLSKYENLRILSFYKCEIGNSIPYFSIAAWHGFKVVEIFDVRLSGLGNPFLKSMSRCPRLRRLYFQNKDTSYVWDLRKIRKKLKIEEEVTYKLVDVCHEPEINEKGTLDLGRMVGELKQNEEESWECERSYLYEDPYRACLCGGTGRSRVKNDPDAFLLERRHQIRHCRRRRPISDSENVTTDSRSLKRKNHVFENICTHNSKIKKINDESKNDIDMPSCSHNYVNLPSIVHDITGKNDDSDSSSEDEVLVEKGVINAVINVDLAAPAPIDYVVRNLNFVAGDVEILRFGVNGVVKPTSSLRRISFRGFRDVTDAVLKNLEKLNLEILDVTHTRVTSQGLEDFLKVNPDCRIVHENYCVCLPFFNDVIDCGLIK